MKIKKKELKSTIKFKEDGIRNTKTVLRSRHNSQTCYHQSDLISSRKDITLLYALMAHSRGRVHMQGMTLDDQADYLNLYKEEFEKYLDTEPEVEVKAEMPAKPPKPAGLFHKLREFIAA